MLRPRLIGAGGAGGTDPIEVGSSSVNTGISSYITLFMPGGVQVGDYAIIIDTLSHNSSVGHNLSLGLNTSTMTQGASLFANDNYDVHLKMYHGVLTDAVNHFRLTRFTTYFGSGSGGAIFVFRNVTGITNLQTLTAFDTNDPSIPSITCTSDDSLVVAAAASAHNAGARSFGGTSNFSPFTQGNQNSTRDITFGMGVYSGSNPSPVPPGAGTTISGEQFTVPFGTAGYSSTASLIFELVNG